MFFEPNARLISNLVADPGTLPGNAQPGKSRASGMLWQWGQLMDHDIGLTEGVAEAFATTTPTCNTTDTMCPSPLE
jgi:peroxidase